MVDGAVTPAGIIAFWLEAGPEKWFRRDADFDAELARRYGAVNKAARAGDYDVWADSADGTVALILVLDQFSRNLYRDSAEAFAADEKARGIAGRAIARGFDDRFELPLRRFIYMPYMHSEDLDDQERCIALCAACGDEEGVKHARIHADVIRRFGRFPHRNKALGRETLPEEQEFLDDGGVSA